MGAFATKYASLLALYYREPCERDGISASVMNSCESRLDLVLPKSLKDFYSIAGAMDELASTYHHISAADQLAIDASSGKMIVCRENQNVVFWGIAVTNYGSEQDDPPVFQAVNREVLLWEKEYDHLSEFFITILYMQLLYGSVLPYRGFALVGASTVDQIKCNWTQAHQLRDPYPLIYGKEGQLMSVEPPDETSLTFSRLRVVTRDKSDFDHIEQTLGLRWTIKWPSAVPIANRS